MNKYRNIKTAVDGITFDSKLEAKRYGELKLLEMAGEIHLLELQPKYRCVIGGEPVCTYIADFRYADKHGVVWVEDVKGMKTPVYRLKKKLTEALHGITITEITK